MKYCIFHIDKKGKATQVAFPFDIINEESAQAIANYMAAKWPGEKYEVVKELP